MAASCDLSTLENTAAYHGCLPEHSVVLRWYLLAPPNNDIHTHLPAQQNNNMAL